MIYISHNVAKSMVNDTSLLRSQPAAHQSNQDGVTGLKTTHALMDNSAATGRPEKVARQSKSKVVNCWQP